MQYEVLKRLNEVGCGSELYNNIPEEVVWSACRKLHELRLINTAFVEGGSLFSAMILPTGRAYLYENPTYILSEKDELAKLQIELTKMQVEELEYKKKIRSQESIIRHWKLMCAIIGFIGIVGWVLGIFKIF